LLNKKKIKKKEKKHFKDRREMPEGIGKKFKLVYLKETPFVDLVEKKTGLR
jgi:hypothetical protein